jgi:hypothetical protein
MDEIVLLRILMLMQEMMSGAKYVLSDAAQ